MSFTKIQPQQIQLPTFFSSSGDITFSDYVTGVDAQIGRNLTGDFSITGSLLLNGGELFASDPTNSFDSISGNRVFGGSNNIATGTYNTILAGDNNTVSGEYNVVVNGVNVNFGENCANNTSVAGDSINFDDNITGSVVIADSQSSLTASTNDKLYVKFASGHEFAGGSTIFDTNVQFNSPYSGVFDGNLQVNGFSYFNQESRFLQDVFIDGDIIVTGSTNFTGDHFINGNSYFNGDISVTGAINCTEYISGNSISASLISGSEISLTNSGAINGELIATQDWVIDQGYVTISDTESFIIGFPTSTSIEQQIWLDANEPLLDAPTGAIYLTPISGDIFIQDSTGFLIVHNDYFTGIIKFDNFTADTDNLGF